jgi:NADH-quinone oxidoreductase subunit L
VTQVPVALTAVLVPLLPAAAFLVLVVFGRRLGERSGWVAIGALAGSLVCAIALLVAAVEAEGKPVVHATFRWATIGHLGLDFGVYVDGLSASVLLMVAIVALMVFVYATGYMHGDKRYPWFFAVFSLFTCSMFALVTSANLLQLMVFWEVMGLCSYLLIGFWYEREEARRASIKAFLTTRVGDMGFLLGVIVLLAKFGTLDIPTLMTAGESVPRAILLVACLLLFGGAVGKSAQFPLHIWLPDAMAGPTPVSGLLHSATMVAAGVFLVARTYPLFEISGALPFVAGAGIASAVFGASLALTETDIKRTLAYSTMSQLGYMMAALGVGGYVAAVFHLITHGFFKSLLFLSAGSVIHGSETQDVREMGGLAKTMRITSVVYLVGALALAGIPPLAGFFSKDAILLSMWAPNAKVASATLGHPLFFVALATAMLTAFYMFRQYFMVFTGPEKRHAHESPRAMLVPMVVLAVLTSLAGVINLPVVFSKLGELLAPGEVENALWWLMLLSATAAATGVYIAWEQNRARLEGGRTQTGAFGLERVYGSVFIKPVFAVSDFLRRLNIDNIVQRTVLDPVMAVSDFLRGADIDVVYNAVFVRFTAAFAEGLRMVDDNVIDGTVNLLGRVGLRIAGALRLVDVKAIDGGVNAVGGGTAAFGGWLKRLQTGVVANYALFMLLFGIIIFYLAKGLAR